MTVTSEVSFVSDSSVKLVERTENGAFVLDITTPRSTTTSFAKFPSYMETSVYVGTYYIPSVEAIQRVIAKHVKPLTSEVIEHSLDYLRHLSEGTHGVYLDLTRTGSPEHIARMVLPSNVMVQFKVKVKRDDLTRLSQSALPEVADIAHQALSICDEV